MNLIKLVFFPLFILFLISNSFSIECSADGMITSTIYSLDDDTFSYDFDGTSGIIYKLEYDSSTDKYNLWMTNNLPTKTELGANLQYYKGIDVVAKLSDSSKINEILEIDTSMYDRIHLKETYKNTGSCQGYRYRSMKHQHTWLPNFGGSGITLTHFAFNTNPGLLIEPTKEISYTYYHDIKNYYYGMLQSGSFLRDHASSTNVFQYYRVNFYLDGSAMDPKPIVNIKTGESYLLESFAPGSTKTLHYNIHNPASTSKEIEYNVFTYVDTYPEYVSYGLNFGTTADKVTIPANSDYEFTHTFTVPAESELKPFHEIRYRQYFHVYDPIIGKTPFLLNWPIGGNPDKAYLKPLVYSGNFLLETNNEGVPQISSKYNLEEYNVFSPKTVNPNTYSKKISIHKKEGNIWSNIFEEISNINEIFGPDENKDYFFKLPILDFYNWEGLKLKFTLEMIYNSNNMILYRDPRENNDRFSFDVDLSHLLMSTDIPAYIYPNAGSKKIFIRDILFNLKDYRLRGVNITTKILDPNTGLESSDFAISNPTNFDVPAQASYPIPIEVDYSGSVIDKRYLLEIEYKYYDEINDITKQKTIYGDVYIKPDLVSGNYYDVLPTKIEFENLYLDKESEIKVSLENQGNNILPSSHKVSLYYKKLSDSSFSLLESKTVLNNQNEVIFLYTPTDVDSVIFKVVVDESNDILENSIYTPYGEDNNALASIAFVRHIDMVLKRAIPVYDDISEQGIIPFEIEVYNAGTGGVDEFTINLNISWQDNSWYFNETFYNIPQEGRNFTYYWDVSDVTPGPHMYSANVTPLYDKDFSNNKKTGAIDFCALPWEGSSVLDCFSKCSNTCVNPLSKRYIASCDNVAGCSFYNSTIAKLCNGGFENTYVDFNETHEALCPDAKVIQLKKITDDKLRITSNCNSLITINKPVLFRGESVIMKLIECVR